MEEKDTKGQIIETAKKNIKDSFVSYLFSKRIRYSEAIYLLSDSIKDEEPIKFKLRTIGASLLSFSESQKESFLENTLYCLLDLEIILKFSAERTLISKMNSEIFLDEIQKVKQEIEQKIVLNKRIISDLFFVEREDNERLMSSGLNSFKQILIKRKEGTERISKGHNNMSFRNMSHKNKESYNSREGEILSIIKDLKEVSIKDISDRVKNCSEKTIQRELSSLVLKGVIKKTGERRWSRYSVMSF